MTNFLLNALKSQPKTAVDKLPVWGEAQSATLTNALSARSGVISHGKPTGDAQLDLQAKNLVGQTFFATMLKQMHDSPFKSELFSGGRGGEAFNGLYDQTLSQHMAQKVGQRFTRPIVAKYKAAAKAAYEKQQQQHSRKDLEYVPGDHRA